MRRAVNHFWTPAYTGTDTPLQQPLPRRLPHRSRRPLIRHVAHVRIRNPGAAALTDQRHGSSMGGCLYYLIVAALLIVAIGMLSALGIVFWNYCRCSCM